MKTFVPQHFWQRAICGFLSEYGTIILQFITGCLKEILYCNINSIKPIKASWYNNKAYVTRLKGGRGINVKTRRLISITVFISYYISLSIIDSFSGILK